MSHNDNIVTDSDGDIKFTMPTPPPRIPVSMPSDLKTFMLHALDVRIGEISDEITDMYEEDADADQIDLANNLLRRVVEARETGKQVNRHVGEPINTTNKYDEYGNYIGLSKYDLNQLRDYFVREIFNLLDILQGSPTDTLAAELLYQYVTVCSVFEIHLSQLEEWSK